jgi:hypothetical protein
MAALAPKDCKSTLFMNTRLVGFGDAQPNVAPGRENRVWSEEWTVWECGVTGIVTLRFTPDATGTGISSLVNATRKISP